MDQGWKIRSGRGRCETPGCASPPVPEYYAVLQPPEYTRQDLCPACFARAERDSATPLIFWRARRSEAKQGAPVLDLESLRVLFERLGERDDDQARGLRFLVALLLLRKRQLKLADARTPAQEGADLVLLDPRQPDAEPIALIAPPLDEERLAALKVELLSAIAE
jgi:hypothetical protein